MRPTTNPSPSRRGQIRVAIHAATAASWNQMRFMSGAIHSTFTPAWSGRGVNCQMPMRMASSRSAVTIANHSASRNGTLVGTRVATVDSALGESADIRRGRRFLGSAGACTPDSFDGRGCSFAKLRWRGRDRQRVADRGGVTRIPGHIADTGAYRGYGGVSRFGGRGDGHVRMVP